MIKTLSVTQLEELFKILQKEDCQYTLNNNGVFLNLTWLNEDLLDKIELFINFCDASKKELERYEDICRDLLTPDHSSDPNTPTEEQTPTQPKDFKRFAPKVSTSMKFYLLKKKFAKVQSGVFNGCESILEKEPYLKK